MIKNKKDKPKNKTIEIDLTGPDGNAYVLMAYARQFARQLAYDEDHIERIIDEMTIL